MVDDWNQLVKILSSWLNWELEAYIIIKIDMYLLLRITIIFYSMGNATSYCQPVLSIFAALYQDWLLCYNNVTVKNWKVPLGGF
jgi:hypothetical protein